MIKYVASSVAYDFDRRLFIDVSKKVDIGGKWWDVFNYAPYRLEYKMANGKDLSITEEEASRLPIPDMNEENNLPRDAVSVTSNEQTIEMVKKEEGKVSNGPIDIMTNNVLGLPIWVWVLSAGTLLFIWKPAFITNIGSLFSMEDE